MIISDQKERDQALNTQESFIIQAPAGSGKTELLTQRFLALLAKSATAPEEILAITFTRKAASEMRSRIVQALLKAKNSPENILPHEAVTYQLAKQVLAKDKQEKWCLLENPNRLKITTIDAFCLSIVSQLPILSGLGAKAKVTEHADHYYLLAIKKLFMHLAKDDPWQQDIHHFLTDIDNDYERAETLLINMLKTREQWLTYLSMDLEEALETLENTLHAVITHHLEKLRETLLEIFDENELMASVRFSIQCHPEHETTELKAAFALMTTLPETNPEDLSLWQYITQLFITQELSYRKTIDKRLGFPAEKEGSNPEEKALFKAKKQDFLKHLDTAGLHPALLNLLADVALLPPATYYENPAIHQKIAALFQVLKLTYAELKLIFRDHNVADFNEIAIAATLALKKAEHISDIALALDYKIKHILIDEFQDTSKLQFSLLQSLTAGWQTGDGKTVFLVGDPMQSIYRFRQAEVGLFLQVKHHGIHDMKLNSLVLRCNFRSNDHIIHWVNEHFKTAFPLKEDIGHGAITFSPSQAVKKALEKESIFYHPIKDHETETHHICQLIQTALNENPNITIAVLVRKKKQLFTLIDYLKIYSIPFEAIDIDTLIEKPIIQDLMALTCALSYLADKVAWLALLRSPWVGLALEDVLIIAEKSLKQVVINTLNDEEILNLLSPDAKKILSRILPILNFALNERGRFTLKTWVDNTWRALGGQYTITDHNESYLAQRFFQLLTQFEEEFIDFHTLKAFIRRHFGVSNQNAANVQLMTIHKSKGLEFDMIILPALEEGGAVDTSHLLAWHEEPGLNQDFNWLLAPKKASGAENDPMYQYIKQINHEKNQLELTRLFYVAITRSKHVLHLFFNPEAKNFPEKNSLLGVVYPTLAPALTVQAAHELITPLSSETMNKTTYKRLPSTWEHPTYQMMESSSLAENKHFMLALNFSHDRAVGIVTHELLKFLTENPRFKTSSAIKSLHLVITHELKLQGITPDLISKSLNFISECLLNTLNDERGSWLLNGEHEDSRCEFPLSITHQGNVQDFIVDRTFIDKQGNRWIVDYKTTNQAILNKGDFLRAELIKYQGQLNTYGKIFRHLEDRPIKLALYYPYQQLWYDWSYDLILRESEASA